MPMLAIVAPGGEGMPAMSGPNIEPREAPSPAWLADLDLDAFVRVTRWPVERALAEPSHEYVEAPWADGEVVAAVIHDRTTYQPKNVQVRINGIHPSLRWSCPGYKNALALPPEVVSLLADLAMSRELREALLAGRPTRDIVTRLSEIREAAAAAHRFAAVIDGWAPSSAGGQLSIEVELLANPTYFDELEPSVLVRLRAPGNRRVLLMRELQGMRLSRDLRRLVGLCSDLHGKAGITATDGCAALVLELLRDHPEWPIRGVQISRTPVRPQLVRGKAEKRTAQGWDGVPPPWSHARSTKTKTSVVDALLLSWQTEDGAFTWPAQDVTLIEGPVSFIHPLGTRQVFPVHPSVDLHAAARLQHNPALEVPGSAWETAYRRIQIRLAGAGVALPTRAAVGLPEATAPVLALRIDGAPLDVQAFLEADYGGVTVAVTPATDDGLLGGAGPVRDLVVERAAVQRVLECGLYANAEQRGFAAAEGAAVAFWTGGLPRLRGEGQPAIQVYLSDRLAGVRVRGPVKVRVKASLVGGLLDTALSFEADELAAEMSAMREAIAKKRRWVLLRDGSIAEVPPEAMALAAEAEPLLDEQGRGRLSVPQLGLLEHWASSAERVEVDPALEALRAKLRSLEVRPAEVPRGLDATLRPYQEVGLAWLQFLSELCTGGILADDMGLGKTLMSLAFLRWKKETGAVGPALVVCPTSVAGNWAREAARFTPGLRVLPLTGPTRAARFAEIGEADLVVTTYALLRLDVEQLSGVLFHTVILDEAQNVKNTDAATTRAARRLRGDQRIALTGTPVENRLGELRSILDLVSPGILGSERAFDVRFEQRIGTAGGERAAAELRARVRPFVLRRTKAQVLTELPPKQEIDVTCLPGAAQRKAYDALAAIVQGDVDRSVAAKGLSQSGLIVLTALLRLRQMACDPRLVDPARPAQMSAKREAFLSLVRELRDEGRRALVFSQFVELLTLWRRDLDREGISYEYLDGSTTRRDEVVERFQKGTATLFLLSLKAGGAGLNLTAADTVIHCDPWWNPAVEMQATDRAHRMGQARSVTVYRLILRGSIEEKIAELKAKKRAVADAVIRDDGGALRGLDESDVQLLLSGVDEDALGEVDLDAEVIEVPAEPRGAERGPTTDLAAPERRLTAPRARAAPTAGAPGVAAHSSSPVRGPAGADADADAAEVLEGDDLLELVAELREHLRHHAMMQKDLAERVGLSQSQVSQLLNGHVKRVRGSTAARLREVLRG
jgi:superfamily II DNA or RNA helicase/predicted XRE-type DNA-binding protein